MQKVLLHIHDDEGFGDALGVAHMSYYRRGWLESSARSVVGFLLKLIVIHPSRTTIVALFIDEDCHITVVSDFGGGNVDTATCSTAAAREGVKVAHAHIIHRWSRCQAPKQMKDTDVGILH